MMFPQRFPRLSYALNYLNNTSLGIFKLSNGKLTWRNYNKSLWHHLQSSLIRYTKVLDIKDTALNPEDSSSSWTTEKDDENKLSLAQEISDKDAYEKAIEYDVKNLFKSMVSKLEIEVDNMSPTNSMTSTVTSVQEDCVELSIHDTEDEPLEKYPSNLKDKIYQFSKDELEEQVLGETTNGTTEADCPLIKLFEKVELSERNVVNTEPNFIQDKESYYDKKREINENYQDPEGKLCNAGDFIWEKREQDFSSDRKNEMGHSSQDEDKLINRDYEINDDADKLHQDAECALLKYLEMEHEEFNQKLEALQRVLKAVPQVEMSSKRQNNFSKKREFRDNTFEEKELENDECISLGSNNTDSEQLELENEECISLGSNDSDFELLEFENDEYISSGSYDTDPDESVLDLENSEVYSSNNDNYDSKTRHQIPKSFEYISCDKFGREFKLSDNLYPQKIAARIAEIRSMTTEIKEQEDEFYGISPSKKARFENYGSPSTNEGTSSFFNFQADSGQIYLNKDNLCWPTRLSRSEITDRRAQIHRNWELLSRKKTFDRNRVTVPIYLSDEKTKPASNMRYRLTSKLTRLPRFIFQEKIINHKTC